MRTTLNIDDKLLEKASLLTGIKEKTSLVRLGLEALIALELSASNEVWTQYYNYETAVKKLEYAQANLESSSDLFIGENAVVKAEIEANLVSLKGNVKGNVKAIQTDQESE